MRGVTDNTDDERIKKSRKGISVNVWLNESQVEKLEAFAKASGKNRSDVLRNLIDGRPIRDVSNWKIYAQLADIGCLIMRLAKLGKEKAAYETGVELLQIARRMESSATNFSPDELKSFINDINIGLGENDHHLGKEN